MSLLNAILDGVVCWICGGYVTEGERIAMCDDCWEKENCE